MKLKDFSGGDQREFVRVPWQEGSQPVSPILPLQVKRKTLTLSGETVKPADLSLWFQAASLIMLQTRTDIRCKGGEASALTSPSVFWLSVAVVATLAGHEL